MLTSTVGGGLQCGILSRMGSCVPPIAARMRYRTASSQIHPAAGGLSSELRRSRPIRHIRTSAVAEGDPIVDGYTALVDGMVHAARPFCESFLPISRL